MTAYDVIYMAAVNDTDAEKVSEISASIKKNGWVGMPILVSESRGCLVTGSHRRAALKKIADEDFDFDLDELGDVAENVDDIIEQWCEENDTCFDDIPFNNLSTVFAGTWVAEYKDELAEW